ncbi:MAG: hypothetical protein IH956_01795 [Chloroflexi bacterium]|nr:hypothetical protein [Chloroflexota bacterium]
MVIMSFDSAVDAYRDPPFRFFDNREKYLLFVSTCNEKQVIADRIAMDTRSTEPGPTGLRVFDAGMGDGTVLTRVMRYLHSRFPEVPFLIVAKEASVEDVSIGLDKMADRFFEHPAMVLVITNMLYSEAPQLYPRSKSMQARLNWVEMPLYGSTAHEFDTQIGEQQHRIREWWQTRPSEKTGNPMYVSPSVLVMYRSDRARELETVMPRAGDRGHEYDVIIAAQPFRASTPADVKVRNVLAPLAKSLAKEGRMVVIQSTGKDPGMEIVQGIWPEDTPFKTPRQILVQELASQLGHSHPDLRFISYPDSHAIFRYALRVDPSEVAAYIGTSTILAAWNAATYVAQIDDRRLRDAMSSSEYLDVTSKILNKYGGLWFADESFLVTRV